MVGIIPKKTKKEPHWHNFAFYVAIGLLIAVVLVYAFLFYLEAGAYNSLQNVEERISQLATKEERLAEFKVLSAEKKINNFSTLLQEHKKPSNFFAFLEENCHPKVWFSALNLDSNQAQATVSGQAASFEVLDQQHFIFREHKMVKDVKLINISIGQAGEVEFGFSLSLDQRIFQ